jgi:hypothetical protein
MSVAYYVGELGFAVRIEGFGAKDEMPRRRVFPTNKMGNRTSHCVQHKFAQMADIFLEECRLLICDAAYILRTDVSEVRAKRASVASYC